MEFLLRSGTCTHYDFQAGSGTISRHRQFTDTPREVPRSA